MFKVLHLIAPQMRAPQSGTISGWVAMKLMERGNPPSVREGIQRLDIQEGEVFVEIGAGHGVGMREAFSRKPKRIVAVEISDAFFEKLHAVKQELGNDDSIEIYEKDAKNMDYLENNSVDKMFAMNVVYFLDPLDVYLTEIHRVLKPQGTLVFGCKFGAVKDASPPFVNIDKDFIENAMTDCGFDVSSTKVELEERVYSYTEIKGIKQE